MPAKREAKALQEEVTNQEQWDDLMGKERMTVVDVYQKWCGPCAATGSLFRKLKNESGDELLHFAVAECDGIEALEKYRGRCEPCFLFFAGGQLVEVIRGAQGPVLARAVGEQLIAERKVMDEGAERKAIKDPMLAAFTEQDEERAASAEAETDRKAEEEARAPVPKQVTVVLIKPDAVKEEKVEEIKQKIVDSGFEILTEEDRTLTEDEAKEFYKDQEGEDHFESLVQFMCGGPSHIMVVTKGDTGEGVVHEVRSLIGPKDTEVAKEEAPESLRALYGTDKTMNAMHGADSGEMAARELSFFFPEFVAPIVPGTGPPPKIQKTLALIRPDALKEHKDSILEKVKEAGFEVCLQKEIQLTEEQAKEFYKEQEGTPHFEDLIREMTSGPVLALGLAKEEAVEGWRNMLGPKEVEVAKTEAPDSLRAQFSHPDSSINGLHGSDSPNTAEQELNYFFPVEHTLAVIKPDASVEQRDVIIERIKEAGFNIACQKEMDLPKDLACQLYKEHEGKEFYDNLVDYMTSGPSMVMVLSREDAITGWRTIMGPTDPEVAKEQAPESLRALLGKDILQNAIHGSSTKDHATEKIQALFPEVEIKEDGQLIAPETSQADVTTNNVAGEEGAEEAQEGEGEATAEGEAAKTEEPGADDEAADEGRSDEDSNDKTDKEEPTSAGEGDDEKPQQPEKDNEETTEEGDKQAETGGEKETDQENQDDGDTKEEPSPEDNSDKQEEDSAEAKEDKPAEEGEKTEEQATEEPATEEPKGDEGKPEGEEKPAEGEAAAAEGTEEQKQEDKPAEGEATAAEEAKPEEAEAKPEGEAAATPAEGETKTEGEEAPKAETPKPEGDEVAKTEGEEAAKTEGEDAAKAEGEDAAKTEGDEPAKAEGEEAPKAEEDGEAKPEAEGEKKEEPPAE